MSNSKLQVSKIIGLPLISVVATFALLALSALVVSGLPRPREQEPVSVSWSTCVLGAVGVALFLPWLISLPFMRNRGTRIYFFLWLAMATTVWYFVGMEGFLNKAYRRGF